MWGCEGREPPTISHYTRERLDQGAIPRRLPRVLSEVGTGNIYKLMFVIWGFLEKSLHHRVSPKCGLETPTTSKLIPGNPWTGRPKSNQNRTQLIKQTHES